MTELLIAILGSGALMFILKWAKEAWERWQNRRHPTRSAADFEIRLDNLLYEALYSTNADRVLLLRTTNGGGRIRPGKPIYIEIYKEKRTENLRSVREDFQGVEMDLHYAEMIQQLIQKEKINYVTADMPADNILSDTYKADGVVQSKVRYVWEADNFWYISFQTASGFNEHDRHRFEVITRKMRTLFRRKL